MRFSTKNIVFAPSRRAALLNPDADFIRRLLSPQRAFKFPSSLEISFPADDPDLLLAGLLLWDPISDKFKVLGCITPSGASELRQASAASGGMLRPDAVAVKCSRHLPKDTMLLEIRVRQGTASEHAQGMFRLSMRHVPTGRVVMNDKPRSGLPGCLAFDHEGHLRDFQEVGILSETHQLLPFEQALLQAGERPEQVVRARRQPETRTERPDHRKREVAPQHMLQVSETPQVQQAPAMAEDEFPPEWSQTPEEARELEDQEDEVGSLGHAQATAWDAIEAQLAVR